MQECRMVQLSVIVPGCPDSTPVATAIVIAPSMKEAVEYGTQELKPWAAVELVAPIVTDLGPILFQPFPTTIFLHNEAAGRIK